MSGAVVIGLVLAALGTAGMWGMIALNARLDGKVVADPDALDAAIRRHPAGKGNASQALGSPGEVKVSIVVKDEMSAAIANVLASLPAAAPAPPPWPTLPAHRTGLCGAYGPDGMRCDRGHHSDARHEQDGYGWWSPRVPHPGDRGLW